MVTAGRLRTLLEILRRRETVTASGGTDVSWEVAGELFADKRPITGAERLRAEQMTPTVSHRFMVRAEPVVTPKDRLRESDGTLYDIRAVLPDQMGRDVEILATQKVTT